MGDDGSSSGYAGTAISFSQPLATGIADEHAVFNGPGKTSEHCPGFGKAAAGYLCVYAKEEVGMPFFGMFGFETATAPPSDADQYGTSVYFNVTAPGYTDGSWTVTAP